MLGKRGGRLIEDHHLGVESQRPGNRHHVTLGDAEGFQRGSRVDLDFQPGLKTLDWPAMHRRANEILTRLEVQIDPRATLKTLSIAQRHMVAIARAV